MKLGAAHRCPAQMRIANCGALADTGLPSTLLDSPRHGPHTIQNPGRAVDGRLALPDADHRGRRPRGGARDQRVPAHGDALDPRLPAAVPADPRQRRICRDEDDAAAAARGAQPHSLRRAARLVLRADTDPDRPGGGDRIHHADLDRDPGRELSRRAHDDLEDRGDRARASSASS